MPPSGNFSRSKFPLILLDKTNLLARDLTLIKKLIERRIGIDLSGYKDEFIRRRIHARMMSSGVRTINQYLKVLVPQYQ